MHRAPAALVDLRPWRGRTTHVADALREVIVRGDVGDGEFLGTEGDLAAHFGISRPSMREALGRLEGEGLVEVTLGVGGGVTARRPDERMTARAVAEVLRTPDVETSDLVITSSQVAATIAGCIARARRRHLVASELRSLIPRSPEGLTADDQCRGSFAFQRGLIDRGPSPTMNVLAATLHEVVQSHVTPCGARGVRLCDRASPPRSIQRRLVELNDAGVEAAAAEHWKRYLSMQGRTLVMRPQ